MRKSSQPQKPGNRSGARRPTYNTEAPAGHASGVNDSGGPAVADLNDDEGLGGGITGSAGPGGAATAGGAGGAANSERTISGITAESIGVTPPRDSRPGSTGTTAGHQPASAAPAKTNGKSTPASDTGSASPVKS